MENRAATPALARICLVMIVKNEAAVLGRCLNSVKGLIDYWVICDTGSTDATREMVRQMLSEIPGELHEMPWVNFGHNRTQAIALAKGKADYLLVVDADMTVNVHGEFRHRLTADAFLIRFEGNFEYYLPLLVSDRHEWRHIGVTHEYLHSDTAKVREKLPEMTVTHHCDGHNRADKFRRDVDLLTKALVSEPDNPRSTFYLAQSYRDLGLGYQALEYYARRVALGGWEEETWYARYQIARLKHQSALPWPPVLHAYLDAWQHRPWRLEPLLPVARYYREARQFHLGLMFSRAAVEMPYPNDLLFIERNVYEHELPLEYAICCYWLGLHEEAIRVNDEILARESTPAGIRETAARNRRFSVEAMANGPAACPG